MHWDFFTVLQQLLILLTMGAQLAVSTRVIRAANGNERWVRTMSFATGLLIFLLCRPLGLTFADLMIRSHQEGSMLDRLLSAGVFPATVGLLVAEGLIFAMHTRQPVPVRAMLTMAAFTVAQAAYTNLMAYTKHVTTLDRAFIPNLCYAVAVGLWMTWRYREDEPVKLS